MVTISRRTALLSLGLVPAVLACRDGQAADATAPQALNAGSFDLKGTYLNAAYTHPMPIATAEAVRAFVARRIGASSPHAGPDARALFAKLINASPREIAYIPSTSYGENFVVAALGLKQEPARARVLTDVLHFDGSLYMYQELASRGLDLTVLPMTSSGEIHMNALESALRGNVKLVSISLVSWINGFQHDLRAVCDLAHRSGALVYVDAIQGAGAVPIDVRASGVDFLACSTFKWLMGDFGFGFLYVREDLIPRLRRMEFGYLQVEQFQTHFLPKDRPGARPLEATADANSATGHFEVGTISISGEVAAAASLQQILATDVAKMQSARQPLIDLLQDRLSPRYSPLTPQRSRSPIVSFVCEKAEEQLAPRLMEAGIRISLYDNRFRVSPSVYNTRADVDRLCDVLLA